MFHGVGRRLALLNAVVVIAIIGVTGAAIYLLLNHQLDTEVDNALIANARQTAGFVLTSQPTPSSTTASSESEDEHHEHDDDILASGDTIAFAIDSGGQIIYNPRGISVRDVSDQAGIERALHGNVDIRTLNVEKIGTIRVASVPIERDHQVIGAVQVLQSLRAHGAELATVRWVTLLGVALGAVIAVPAGLLLSRRAMRPIDAAFTRQREFVADASHELRTPLTLIRVNAELAREEQDSPVSRVDPELASILEEVDRTDRLIDDLLTLARADANRLELRREPLDLTELAEQVYRDLQPVARQLGVHFHLETAPPCVAVVDPDRIRQLLRILIDNALKYTPAGGDVTLSLAAAAEVHIVIRDTGAGIPAEHLPRLFDRFYRVDKARSRAAGGTGLGLAIARALVEAHGGSISLASTVGQGTTVTVTLPGPGKVTRVPSV